MTRTVNFLADGGYVERRPHASDGRQVVVALTDEGRTVLLADRARRDEWLARRLAGLTPDERDALRRATPILQRLAQSD
jgi:DNA-binding MarR family transcriptional regulator